MNFIHESFIDKSICDVVIACHKDQVKKGIAKQGSTNNLVGTQTNTNLKKSIDADITEDLYQLVNETLIKLANEYIEKFPWANMYGQFGTALVPHIQYYAPNDGFYAWHTERGGVLPSIQKRHLAYMVYLNDVTDGGGTEFYHQNLIFQPVKGKSLIWPVDWTYTHRGIPSPTQEKYILTGWFEFLDS
jgi:hypothetical protein